MATGADRSRERRVTLAAVLTLTAAAVLFVLLTGSTGDYAPVSSPDPGDDG